MTITLYGIPNCDTVKKARVWLNDHGVNHVFHDYKKAGIDRPTLEGWVQTLGWETVLNRSGTTFRALPDDARADLTSEKAVALMLAQPSMIKRPMLTGVGEPRAGFRPDAYAALFQG